MNLHYLRVFCEVAETGSVTRAAERLHISQPAVSHQIKRLEEELGIALLEPHGRGIRLTPTGEAVARQAGRLFALERLLEEELVARRDGQAGRVQIGATNLPGTYLVPGWAARFKQRYPEVEVQVLTDNSRATFQRLHRYEVDLAIMAGGWDEPGIARRVLREDELWFIVGPSHPLNGKSISLTQLAQQPLILREEGSSTRMRLVGLLNQAGLNCRVGLTLQGLQGTIQAAATGFGVAAAPSLTVREQVDAGQLGRVRVDGAYLPFLVSLCTREGEGLSPLAERFCDFVVAS